MMKAIILGGTSDIGLAIAAIYAEKKRCEITLAGRNSEELQKCAEDLGARYTTACTTLLFDAIDYNSHSEIKFEDYDLVVVAFGYLSEEEKARQDFNEARKIIEINYLGAVSLLNLAANTFEQRGSGSIIAVASVAGLRGRASNMHYGSAKAGLIAYLSGLRNRLSASNVNVLTVNPGFVTTKMTQDLDLPPGLCSSPEELAEKVYRAEQSGRAHIYSSFKWWIIMSIIRAIPEGIFKKMKL